MQGRAVKALKVFGSLLSAPTKLETLRVIWGVLEALYPKRR
jgi:hypothetical protein